MLGLPYPDTPSSPAISSISAQHAALPVGMGCRALWRMRVDGEESVPSPPHMAWHPCAGGHAVTRGYASFFPLFISTLGAFR